MNRGIAVAMLRFFFMGKARNRDLQHTMIESDEKRC